jgi:hypothetical protein
MTTRIAIMVEGKTEVAFKPTLLHYLERHLTGSMPKLDFVPRDGRIPKETKLKRQVELLLKDNDFVIALTDVYTGSDSRDFKDATDAKQKMRRWVGREPRFHPHVAQYEFEARLLPYWPRIQKLAGTDRNPPSLNPETVNHARPPAKHLAELFRTGTNKRACSKTRDGAAILHGQDLEVSAARCPELRAFLERLLSLSVVVSAS